MQRKVFPPGLKRLLIISTVLHVLLFAGVVIAGKITRQAPPPVPHEFIPTKLVKLGKKRAKHLLPRLNRPPPPPPKPEVKIAAPAPEAPVTSARPRDATSALARAKDASRVSGALDRLRKKAHEQEAAGDPSGVEDGEVSDLRLAIAGNKYTTEVYRCIKRNYSIEGIDRKKVGKRQATILVKIRGDGRLFGSKLLKSSGLVAFDRAVEKAIKRCGKVSQPPEVWREALTKEGIEIVFKP